jgi:glycosyltransferase involved in cell wall biosynthesis
LAGRVSWQLNQWCCLRAGFKAAATAARATTVDIWETTSTGSPALDFLDVKSRAPIVTRVATTAAQLRSTNAGQIHWINRRLEAWERAAVRRSDRVITHSVSHRQAIAAEFGLQSQAIRVIPLGVPIPAAPRREHQAARCRILYVGRLEHRKGADLLLAALSTVLQAAPHADVVLVGSDRDGYWQNHWLQNAPVEVRDRVRFAGLVDAATLAAQYREADLFVAPSRYESFGLIFVEAMAHALPVVALNAPGASDLMEDNVTGRLVPPEDPPALSAALIALANNPAARARLGQAGRRLAEERYSLPAYARASADFYREVLAFPR